MEFITHIKFISIRSQFIGHFEWKSRWQYPNIKKSERSEKYKFSWSFFSKVIDIAAYVAFMFMNAKRKKTLKGKINEHFLSSSFSVDCFHFSVHKSSLYWCANPARQNISRRKIEKPPKRLDSCVRADVWLSSSQTKLMDFRLFIYYSSFVVLRFFDAVKND